MNNPLPANVGVRIPGATADGDVTWQITSAGGHEHFLIFVSPERLEQFEEMFAVLPQAVFGKAVQSARLSPQMLGKLRGVGGLVTERVPTPPRLATVFTLPLSDGEQTAHGLWVRQLTLVNPDGR